MKRVLLTGATGLVGSRFVELENNKFYLEAILREENKPAGIKKVYKANLTKKDEVKKAIKEAEPEVILHLASFTDVDGAEKERGNEKGAVFALNVLATRYICQAAKERGAKLVYISTDFVFDGKKGSYEEDDETAKKSDDISWYGWTKLLGEKEVLKSGVIFLIARIAYPYRAKYGQKTDFVRNIIERLRNRTLYPMFEDQLLTPTFIDNISRALVILIKDDQEGIWHVVDNTTLSAYHAAQNIADVFDFDKDRVEKGSLKGFFKNHPASAPRPKNGGLKNDKVNKFLAKYQTSMQPFREALLSMKRQVTSDKRQEIRGNW